MHWFLFALAYIGALVVPIAVVVGIFWLLELRDKAKHDRAMAALDERMINALRMLNQDIEEQLAPYTIDGDQRLAPYTIDGDQRLIDKRFDEIVRGSW